MKSCSESDGLAESKHAIQTIVVSIQIPVKKKPIRQAAEEFLASKRIARYGRITAS